MCCEDEPDPASLGPRDEPTRILRRLKAGVEQLRAVPDLSGDQLFQELEAALREIELELRLR